MPTGKVLVHFVGGPLDGEEMSLVSMFSRDVLGMQSEAFFAEAPGGGLSIVKGDALRNPGWISYSRHIEVINARLNRFSVPRRPA